MVDMPRLVAQEEWAEKELHRRTDIFSPFPKLKTPATQMVTHRALNKGVARDEARHGCVACDKIRMRREAQASGECKMNGWKATSPPHHRCMQSRP